MSKTIECEKRKEEMRKLYESGMTFAEVGEEFGISKQRVFQLIGGKTKNLFRTVNKERCIYDGLRKWLNDNRISVHELTRRLYGDAHALNYKRTRDKLCGVAITKEYIDKFREITGLTYEELFVNKE